MIIYLYAAYRAYVDGMIRLKDPLYFVYSACFVSAALLYCKCIMLCNYSIHETLVFVVRKAHAQCYSFRSLNTRKSHCGT